MERYHVRAALREIRYSGFEKTLLAAGVTLLVAAAVAALSSEDLGGLAWELGTSGLGAFALWALSRGARVYRADAGVALPASVGRVGVRVRPRRATTALTAAFALLLPAAAAAVLVVVVEWGWLAMAAGLAVAFLGQFVTSIREGAGDRLYIEAPDRAIAVLERLCMRADLPVPQLIMEPGPVANAWTTRGRIHVTIPLLGALDDSELEAVLAHELAHFGNRDGAVMDVCSAPSRVLLGFAGSLASLFRGWIRNIADVPFPGVMLYIGFFAAISVPPAAALGWVARLSVLVLSRGREFAADAAAAALTGRPSALASALMKLDDENDYIPRADLRAAEARAVLSIVGTDRSRLGRLFRTHPPVATRVKRLQALEERVQAGRSF